MDGMIDGQRERESEREICTTEDLRVGHWEMQKQRVIFSLPTPDILLTMSWTIPFSL